MNYIIDVIKALGFPPLPTAIIILLVFAIYMLLRRAYKGIEDKFEKVISTRADEIKVVKVSLEALTKEIEEVKESIAKNNKTTTLLTYHQCMNEAMNWKDKGEIPVGAKMHFDKVWEAYEGLGDGHGDDPKKMIDALPIVN